MALAFIARMKPLDDEIRAFVHVDTESTVRQACAMNDKRIGGGNFGALGGVPLTIEDSLCTVDAPTT